MTEVNEVVSINEACQALGISRMTLYRWMRKGKLHPVPVGGRQMIAKDEVQKLKS